MNTYQNSNQQYNYQYNDPNQSNNQNQGPGQENTHDKNGPSDDPAMTFNDPKPTGFEYVPPEGSQPKSVIMNAI